MAVRDNDKKQSFFDGSHHRLRIVGTLLSSWYLAGQVHPPEAQIDGLDNDVNKGERKSDTPLSPPTGYPVSACSSTKVVHIPDPFFGFAFLQFQLAAAGVKTHFR
jgi:hypothetical protein